MNEIHVAIPRNVKGWERAYATARKIGATFELIDTVEFPHMQWRDS